MLGKRTDQSGLLEANRLQLDMVGRDIFYGLLDRLFCDADFTALRCLDNGCSNVPPSLSLTASQLQSYDKAS